MKVDIVGEDEVTRAVLKRLFRDLRLDIEIDKILPARGGQIKVLAPKYNALDLPIILLTDLDTYDCPPSLIQDWFKGVQINKNYLFRIAYGEAESWLMADRTGFSRWIGSKITSIPDSQIIDRRKNIKELVFPYKPSLFLMRDIATKATNIKIKNGLIPKEGSKKGPLYNATLLPFIENYWNIESASMNSTSLQKAIQRIKEY